MEKSDDSCDSHRSYGGESSQSVKLESVNYELRRKVESLEKELLVVKQQFSVQRQELQDMHHDKGRLVKQVQEKCCVVNQQSNKIHALQGMFVGVRRKHDKLEWDLKGAREKLDKTLRENKILRRKVTSEEEAEEREKSLRRRLRDQRGEMEGLKREREQGGWERGKLIKELEEAKCRLKTVEATLSEKNREVQVCQAALSVEKNKLKAAQERGRRSPPGRGDHNPARNRIKMLTRNMATLRREKERMGQTCEEKTRQLQRQKEKLEESQRKITTLQESEEGLKAQVREKAEEMEDLSKERDLVVNFLENVKLAMEGDDQENEPVLGERMKELMEHLKRFMEDKEGKKGAWQKAISDERAKSKAVRTRWRVARRQLATAKKTIADKQRQLDEVSGGLTESGGGEEGEGQRPQSTDFEKDVKALQREKEDLSRQVGKVRNFLENMQQLSGLPQDPDASVEQQLAQFKTYLAPRLGLVTTFCDLVKSLEEDPTDPPPEDEGTSAPPEKGESSKRRPAPQIPFVLPSGKKIKRRQRHGQVIVDPGAGREGGGRYRCFCKFQCNSKYLLKRHILKTSQQKMFQCLRCPTRFLYFGHLKRHMSEVHRAAAELAHYVRGCQACGDIFMTRELYQHHQCRAAPRQNVGPRTATSDPGAEVSRDWSALEVPSSEMDSSDSSDERPTDSTSSTSP